MPDASIGWHPHPDVWVVMAVLVTAYWAAIRRWGPSHVSPGDPAVSRTQVTCFLLGVATLWVASDWPVHDLSEERLFSVHMVQHLLMSLVAPPLLLAGTPGWLLRSALRPRWLLATVRALARPLPALLLFNAFIAFSHWPVIVDLAVRSEASHFALHSALLLTALLMWMPVLSPMFEIPRLRYAPQMLYLFAQSIVPTVPATFLTFAEGPIYPFYGVAAPLIGVDAVADQRVSGLIMKIIGGLILWGFIAVIFFRWHKQEEIGGSDDSGWQRMEREANELRVP